MPYLPPHCSPGPGLNCLHGIGAWELGYERPPPPVLHTLRTLSTPDHIPSLGISPPAALLSAHAWPCCAESPRGHPACGALVLRDRLPSLARAAAIPLFSIAQELAGATRRKRKAASFRTLGRPCGGDPLWQPPCVQGERTPSSSDGIAFMPQGGEPVAARPGPRALVTAKAASLAVCRSSRAAS